MQFETLLYEKTGNIVQVTLNRPNQLNAINPQMERELRQVWTSFKEDSEAFVAILTGAGRGFCAGGDLKSLGERLDEADGTASRHLAMSKDVFRVSPAQNEVWKPVIAAINGVCAGGGLHFAADCDILIASENSSFTDPHVTWGLITAIESLGISRQIPFKAVLRMALMGAHERMPAQRAYELGLVSEVVGSARLMPRAWEIAEAIAQNCPYAVRRTKQALVGGLDTTLRDALNAAWEMVDSTNNSVDAIEGTKAFREKRKPVWRLR